MSGKKNMAVVTREIGMTITMTATITTSQNELYSPIGSQVSGHVGGPGIFSYQLVMEPSVRK